MNSTTDDIHNSNIEVPSGAECILMEIPFHTLDKCSSLNPGDVIQLRGNASDHSINKSIDISVEKTNEVILLTLKAIDSSLQELAGQWRYVINTIHSERNCDGDIHTSKNDTGSNPMMSLDRNDDLPEEETSLLGGLKSSPDRTNLTFADGNGEKHDTETTRQLPEKTGEQGKKEQTNLSSKPLNASQNKDPEDVSTKTTRRQRGRPRKVTQPENNDRVKTKEEQTVAPVTYLCRCCGRKFRLRVTYERHTANCSFSETGSDFVSCRQCRDTFVSLENYKLHLDECIKSDGESEASGRGHSLKLKDQGVCDICFSIFQTRSRMLKHKHRVHQVQGSSKQTKSSRYYPCAFCDQVFTNGSSRHRHQKFYCTHNPDCKRPHCCNQCGNFFACDKDLLEHKQRRHKGALAYVCHLCGIELRSRSSIYFHNLKRHSGKPPKFTCNHCDKAFYTRNKLEKHLTSHSDDRNIQCELCGKQFKTPQHVAQHKKTIHENRYRYRCEKCGHGMEKLQYLQSHKCGRVRRIQENERTVPSTGGGDGGGGDVGGGGEAAPAVASTSTEAAEEPMLAAPSQALFVGQENHLPVGCLLPDVGLIGGFQPPSEPVVDGITPGLAITVPATDQSYVLTPSTPTYAQFMIPDNIRY